MRIAVISETSAASRNADIVKALEGRGHDIVNCGMKEAGASPELSYLHTGFLSALLLHLRRVDFVVGGCGTGQGYLNSVLQYPGTVCGHVQTPLDAWLFARINDGNCVSLALNQGYGWAGDVNLRLLFDHLFPAERGAGYPEHRAEPQRVSRNLLAKLSAATHRDFGAIVRALPDEIAGPALAFPGIAELVDPGSVPDEDLFRALEERMTT